MSISVRTVAKSEHSFEISVREMDHEGLAIPSMTERYSVGFWAAVEILMTLGWTETSARMNLNDRVADLKLRRRMRSTR